MGNASSRSFRFASLLLGAEISNAYLSQLERGLHAPSVRVIESLADALELSAETLLEHAGLLDDPATGGADAEAAIKADPRLTNAQKEALLAVYRGFTADPENVTPVCRGGRR